MSFIIGNVPDTFRADDRYFYSPEHDCLIVQIPSPGLSPKADAPDALRHLLLTKRQPYSIKYEYVLRDSSANIRSLVSWEPARTRGGHLRDERYQIAPPSKEESFIYYMAQCLHYGLDFDLLQPETAKVALRDALAEDHQHILRVPRSLRKLQAKLKAKFERGDLTAIVRDLAVSRNSSATPPAKLRRTSIPRSTQSRDPITGQFVGLKGTRNSQHIDLRDSANNISEAESFAAETTDNDEAESGDMQQVSSDEQNSEESAEEDSEEDSEEESKEESEEESEEEDSEEIEDVGKRFEESGDEIGSEGSDAETVEAASEDESSDEESSSVSSYNPREPSIKAHGPYRALPALSTGEEATPSENGEGSETSAEDTDETDSEVEEEAQPSQEANFEEYSETSSRDPSNESSTHTPAGSSRSSSEEDFSENFQTPPSIYRQYTPLEYSDSEGSTRKPSAEAPSTPTLAVVINTKRKAIPDLEERPKKLKHR